MIEKLLFEKINLKNFTKIGSLCLLVSAFQFFNAQIVYKDVIPDFTTTISSFGSATDVYAIDFNNDNIAEYNFRWDGFAGDWFMHMTYGTNNVMALKGTATNPFGGRFLLPLQANAVIDNNLTWGVSDPEPFIGESTTDTNFQGLGDRYIGVRFKIGANTYYGWVLVSFSNTNTLTIKSFAYNSTANQSILAGQTTLLETREAEVKKETFIFPNPAASEVTVSEKSSYAIFYDVSGKKIMEANVVDNKVINIRDLEDGVYIVNIKTKDGRTTSTKLMKNSKTIKN